MCRFEKTKSKRFGPVFFIEMSFNPDPESNFFQSPLKFKNDFGWIKKYLALLKYGKNVAFIADFLKS